MATRRRAAREEREPRERREPRARRRPKSGGGGSDLVPRILVAVPAVLFAAFIIYEGGWIFAAGIGILGIICTHELSTMLERAHPVRLAAFIGVIGLVVAGTAGGEHQVLLAMMASVPLTFVLAVAMPQRERITASIAVTLLAIVWIGMGVAHASLLRGLPHGGAIVFMILLGTFFGDTFAYLGGRLIGKHKLAPRISPNKTIEGLACGIVLGTLIVWYMSRTYSGNWISGTDGLLLGITITLAAPTGDLFESLIKRDMGTKDTGGLFGAHGGALDRLDAALFALVAGYYVWLALA
jgi:phosphatidate cytidylyltransferase